MYISESQQEEQVPPITSFARRLRTARVPNFIAVTYKILSASTSDIVTLPNTMHERWAERGAGGMYDHRLPFASGVSMAGPMYN